MAEEEKVRQQLLSKALIDLEKAVNCLALKRKEIDSRIRDEQPSLFEDSSKLFDVDICPQNRADILLPDQTAVKAAERAVERLSKPVETTGNLFDGENHN